MNSRRGLRDIRLLFALVVLAVIALLGAASAATPPEPNAVPQDPALGGGRPFPETVHVNGPVILEPESSPFDESAAMKEVMADPENLGRAFAFRKVGGVWVAEDLGPIDEGVRRSMEMDFESATGLMPEEALFGGEQAGPAQ